MDSIIFKENIFVIPTYKVWCSYIENEISIIFDMWEQYYNVV